MPYEIDFHPVGSGANSGDAITMRYWTGTEWRVIVIDAGFQDTGEAIVNHVLTTYGTREVEHVVSTHPDNDHISGLREVISNLTVQNLWMHVPEYHAKSMMEFFRDARWTLDGLSADLRRAYPAVTEILDIAQKRGTTLHPPFQGARIGPFTVLSPTQAMYEGLLPQFRDTPRPAQPLLALLGHWLTGIGRRVASQIRRIVDEDMFTETLREGGITAAENESSVVLYGQLDGHGILLTGDAGLRALDTAVTFGNAAGLPFGVALKVFQVPHHGSRNNISPSMLDRIVGGIVGIGARSTIGCVISAGPDDETHPRQVVVNALVRRGLYPQTTKAGIMLFNSGVQNRQGFGPSPSLQFASKVEAYD